jgi:hypothetical protein
MNSSYMWVEKIRPYSMTAQKLNDRVDYVLRIRKKNYSQQEHVIEGKVGLEQC